MSLEIQQWIAAGPSCVHLTFPHFSPHRKCIADTKMRQVENLCAMNKEGGRTLYLVERMATDGDK